LGTEGIIKAYADDLDMVATSQAGNRAFIAGQASLTEINLTLSLPKCKVYAQDDMTQQRIEALMDGLPPGVTLEKEGILVLGSPIGGLHFIWEIQHRLVEDYETTLERVQQFGQERVQSAWIIFIMSASTRLNFLWRTIPPGYHNRGRIGNSRSSQPCFHGNFAPT
jgi:hypothetical protein